MGTIFLTGNHTSEFKTVSYKIAKFPDVSRWNKGRLNHYDATNVSATNYTNANRFETTILDTTTENGHTYTYKVVQSNGYLSKSANKSIIAVTNLMPSTVTKKNNVITIKDNNVRSKYYQASIIEIDDGISITAFALMDDVVTLDNYDLGMLGRPASEQNCKFTISYVNGETIRVTEYVMTNGKISVIKTYLHKTIAK